MSALSFVLEKVRHGSELSASEVKMVADELERLNSRLQGCAQEVARREEADKISRQQDRDRANRLRLAEEEVARLQDALAHAKRQRITENDAHEERVRFLEEILRDIHFGLLHQPEHSREELAGVIERIPITPHPAR